MIPGRETLDAKTEASIATRQYCRFSFARQREVGLYYRAGKSETPLLREPHWLSKWIILNCP
jgi:hypothetical protein